MARQYLLYQINIVICSMCALVSYKKGRGKPQSVIENYKNVLSLVSA